MSRIIKSPYAQSDEGNKKVITLKPLTGNFFEEKKTIDLTSEPNNDIHEAEKKAEEILREAEEEALSILKDAEKKLNAILQQIESEKQNWEFEKQHLIETARQEGYQRGLELGKQDGFNEYKMLIDQAKETVDLSKNDYLKTVEEAERTILHLGLKAAEKIIGFTLDLNPEAFSNLVKKVIKEVRDHQDVKIYVHPKYYDLMISQKEELKTYFTNPLTELYIYPNEELNQTDCIIESSFGRIDASVDSQLRELKLKLLEMLDGDSNDENG
ncbi:flagellar assembly protein FliH [Calidifontibacillus erzurumensis]|uniref:Flagellar assembly protein FliH n=1 Tax=Calidifontibacillus erzurumensis TaxID=2741433 RepID=A0A8J8GF70_9BACI|nr:flagellar assembly protein FliH [Calidifontibacillus erzurumensis]NSL51185.1 flagellar assembly protein FliH [Calidifontibacillus erzurumensis]